MWEELTGAKSQLEPMAPLALGANSRGLEPTGANHYMVGSRGWSQLEISSSRATWSAAIQRTHRFCRSLRPLALFTTLPYSFSCSIG